MEGAMALSEVRRRRKYARDDARPGSPDGPMVNQFQVAGGEDASSAGHAAINRPWPVVGMAMMMMVMAELGRHCKWSLGNGGGGVKGK
ncbi:MAG: hypothetical protein EA376_13990 [Phycisphaeraceae bacterium]|nr:MAG: hypothetical protein EA376_13990 [Phycisphaeraceae bacterium]